MNGALEKIQNKNLIDEEIYIYPINMWVPWSMCNIGDLIIYSVIVGYCKSDYNEWELEVKMKSDIYDKIKAGEYSAKATDNTDMPIAIFNKNGEAIPIM